jgi:hypothetical protein
MQEISYQLLQRVPDICLILMKVALLLKLALFMRYKTSEWKVEHIVFFPRKDIYESDEQDSKVKKAQNNLTVVFVVLVLLVVAIKTFA